jgi:4-hydroxythreonine-4-phosphate dehydrogenase
VLKSVTDAGLRAACRPVIIADAAELSRQAAALGLAPDYIVVREGEFGPLDSQDVLVVDVGRVSGEVEWGKRSADCGRAAMKFISAGARACLDGKIDAVATAPINKESLKLAGSPFPGHTEMLTSLCGAGDSLMCFFAGDLRVFLLTIHVSLADAIHAITKERVVRAIVLAAHELQRFGLARPRIAVAGLNPHAGEHGMFGQEEGREMEPAIKECRERHGIDAAGPFPADTIFLRAARGEFDAVAACYHDQGLIAVKCLAFGKAVNVTLGLPIIRTSVDHGTAFDIAGRGVADHSSMVEAVKLAAHLVEAERLAASAV